MFARRLAICVFASDVLIVLSLTFARSELAAILSFNIVFVSAILLLAFGIVRRGRQRLVCLFVVMSYVLAALLLKSNFTFVRDHVRWLFLSSSYRAEVLAQTSSHELKHAEWDGWGFAGSDTTAFLVFDPADSLKAATKMFQPVKTRGLPCEVVRVRRLERQWYAVLFYTDTYWGQEACI